ncbi:MAG TPA: hypothetical protein VKT52_12785, partial [Ktedonobacterales bacterium]|nr:hypothetical protein [Ktedonobacterales bacterium]
MGTDVERPLSTSDGQQAARARILAAGIENDLAERAWRMIEDAHHIVILAHEHPDPDALGSALGLAF